MKRITLVLTALLTLFAAFGITAAAEKYNNNAFMGDWLSQGATDTDYAKLHIDYCDDNVISCHFTDVQNGEPKYIYKLYQGQVKDDNKAVLHFDLFDSSGNEQITSGNMELAWFIDNIWISVYSKDGETLYNNMVLPKNIPFNPYASPYSYNVSIRLNGEDLSFDPKPVIVNSRTYVPLRGVFDSMDINVYWDEYEIPSMRTQMITGTNDDLILQITRSSYGYGYAEWDMTRLKDEQTNTYHPEGTENIDISDVQPIIIGSSSYVPLRVIAESFGADIDWDDQSHTVIINFEKKGAFKKSAEEISAIEDFTSGSISGKLNGMTAVYTNPHPYYTKTDKFFEVVVQNGYSTKNILVYNDGHIE